MEEEEAERRGIVWEEQESGVEGENVWVFSMKSEVEAEVEGVAMQRKMDVLPAHQSQQQVHLLLEIPLAVVVRLHDPIRPQNQRIL